MSERERGGRRKGVREGGLNGDRMGADLEGRGVRIR